MDKKFGLITQWFSKKKLSQKVRILFVFILCIYFILTILVYYFVIHRGARDYVVDSNFNRLLAISNTFQMEIESTNTVSKWLINSQEIRSFLRSDEDGTSLLATDAISAIHEFTLYENFLSSVYIFNNDWDSIHVSNVVTQVDYYMLVTPEWYREVKDRAGGYLLRLNGGGAFIPASERTLISFVRQINDVHTQEPIGLLVMNYSADVLVNPFHDVIDGRGRIAYFTKDGTFIGGSEEFRELYYLLEWGEEENIFQTVNNITVYRHHIPETPFVIVSFEESRFLDYISFEGMMLLGVFILITFISLIVLGLFISHYITKPIERLAHSMGQVKSGWFKRVSINLADDEVGHLKDNYNEMLVELNRLIEQLIEKEKTAQQATFTAMQEQIKPHFLYNTLETIGYLALEKPGEEVYEAVESLGAFYRKFLSSGDTEIPLGDELEIIEKYLQLQRLRYENIFTDEYDIQEEKLLKVMVPRLILQPLVENALYHGIRLKGESGVIRISVYEKENKLHISIYDTGVGIDDEKLKTLNEVKNRGFGFRRTIERVRNHYGKEDVYEINSKPGYYCEVILKIPLSSTL